MKCEYCNEEVETGQRESYVTEHWRDVYNKPHTRVLHTANGQNFLDDCYHRFNDGLPKDAVVDIRFSKSDRPAPDYDMLVQVKHKHNLEHLKCSQCGSELSVCIECKKEFSENSVVFCLCAYNEVCSTNHMHAGCSMYPLLSKAIK